jgi:hypothetical protein
VRRLVLIPVVNIALLVAGIGYVVERSSRAPTFAAGSKEVMNGLYASQPYTVVQFLVSGHQPDGAVVRSIGLAGASPGLRVEIAGMAPDEDRVANLEGFPGDPHDLLGEVLRPVRGLPIVTRPNAVTRVYVTITAPRVGDYAIKGLRVRWSNGIYRGEGVAGMQLVLHVTQPGPFRPTPEELRCNQLLSGYVGLHGEPAGCLGGPQ